MSLQTRLGSLITAIGADVKNITTSLDTKYSAINKPGAADLSATGTRDATTYLRGDNTWAPASGGTTPNPIVSGEYDVTANRSGIPAKSGSFTVSDAMFLMGQQLYIQQSGDAISTKGTRPDENEMDHIILRGYISAVGTATVFWSSNTYVRGRFRFNYRSS